MSDVAVIGLGKLGAVMGAVFAEVGHNVVGVDLNPRAVDAINRRQAPIPESGLQDLLDDLYDGGGRFWATLDISEAVANSDIAFVIVPTPSDDAGAFDASVVISTVDQIAAAVGEREYTIVVCSTVMPGTCGELRTRLSENIGLCYSPEFIALGSVIHDMRYPDLVMIGASSHAEYQAAWQVLCRVVQSGPTVWLMSLIDAELAKVMVNSYVTMKISFANQLAAICERIPGADAGNVAEAIGSDSRIGQRYLKPGAPFGGPCFPRDNRAVQALAQSLGLPAPLAAATDEVNRSIAARVVDRLPAEGSVLVLGMSYKPNTIVVEESFGHAVAHELISRGRKVVCHDPSFAWDAQEKVNEASHVVVATAHAEYADLDYSTCVTVVDAWGLTSGDNVIRLGRP